MSTANAVPKVIKTKKTITIYCLTSLRQETFDTNSPESNSNWLSVSHVGENKIISWLVTAIQVVKVDVIFSF